jgi:hypothetical protein
MIARAMGVAAKAQWCKLREFDFTQIPVRDANSRLAAISHALPVYAVCLRGLVLDGKLTHLSQNRSQPNTGGTDDLFAERTQCSMIHRRRIGAG